MIFLTIYADKVFQYSKYIGDRSYMGQDSHNPIATKNNCLLDKK